LQGSSGSGMELVLRAVAGESGIFVDAVTGATRNLSADDMNSCTVTGNGVRMKQRRISMRLSIRIVLSSSGVAVKCVMFWGSQIWKGGAVGEHCTSLQNR
jgi:hypothetical protein